MLSGFRIMWLMVLFDLPVVTKPERKAATGFRNGLLDLGFEMAQYSVYLRFCASQSTANTQVSRVQGMLPSRGKVTILTFTDKQFERAISFHGKSFIPQKTAPKQLEIF
jgi:CRISPR-associated protein Cas2